MKFHDCTGYDALALAKKMTFQNLAEDSKQGAGDTAKLDFDPIHQVIQGQYCRY